MVRMRCHLLIATLFFSAAQAQTITNRPVCGSLDLGNAELTQRPVGTVLGLALSNRCTKVKIYTSGGATFAGKLIQVGSESVVLDTAAGAPKPALVMISTAAIGAVAFE